MIDANSSLHPAKTAKLWVHGPKLWVHGPIAIFSLLVQQGAFVSMPLYLNNAFLPVREDQNDLNTLGIAISFITIISVCLLQRKSMLRLILKNGLTVAFTGLILISSVWSIHPDITLRRGIGYVLTLLVAAYLTVEFRLDQRMKLLSAAFAISAIATVLFVAIFPDYGIMHFAELSGDWRGVFPHKNVLGPVMAVAVFVEIYLLLTSSKGLWWRYGLLGCYLFLVIKSNSATALILTLIYITGAATYILWRKSQLLGITFFLSIALTTVALFLFLWIEPNFALGLLGKDTSLSGRTEVWEIVRSLIRQRPVLGWGYRATWVLGDANTVLADRQVGGWGLGSSHNAFLEITLQLGIFGISTIILIILAAFWRALECMNKIAGPLGWLCIVFYFGAILSGQTEVTLGQNQVIDWMLFNMLFFSCGSMLTSSDTHQPESFGYDKRRSSKQILVHTR